jgi:hypothetical protein
VLATAPPRSALLAAWGTAWLAGEASLTDLVERVAAHDDAHTVTGLAADDLDLERAAARLRAAGVTTLRVVLPAPATRSGCRAPRRSPLRRWTPARGSWRCGPTAPAAAWCRP